jgi:hypothetical protein
MPPIKEHGSVFRDWRGLIDAVEDPDNVVILAGIEPLKEALADHLEEAEALKAEQGSRTGQRKAATQTLGETLHSGKEAARRVRRFIQTRYDSHDERLTQFGITPTRTRRRKVKEPEVPEPPSGPPVEIQAPAAAAAGGRKPGKEKQPGKEKAR